MDPTRDIVVRPARRGDVESLADLAGAPAAPGTSAGIDSLPLADPGTRVVALRGRAGLGTCLITPGAGRCAAVSVPRLREWDEDLAARLLAAAAAQAMARHGARLIQSLVEPDAAPTVWAAYERAGFERLAVLAYLRRPVRPGDLDLEPPCDVAWQRYSRLRRRRFAATIAETYRDTLDCPRLAGLRTVDDSLETHKRTGRFLPRRWHLALVEGKPAGIVLLNDLRGRGELTYLGVVPEARGRGLGRALLERALRDTAETGLPLVGLAVDITNTPAVRLYERAGFGEVRRRVAYFVPRERLDAMAASGSR